MKFLVTGGAGYIGSCVAHQLLASGHQVVVIDNLSMGNRWAVPKEAEFIEGELANLDLVGSLLTQHRFDGVLHFAAFIEVAESVANPAKYYRNNSFLSFGLFDLCVKKNIPKIIFSSTATVYGEPKSDQPMPEDSPLNPVNPYGESKKMSEIMLRDLTAASGGKTKYVALRYFNAAGARRDLKAGQSSRRATHLIKIAAETAVGLRSEIFVNGTDYATADGTCMRDYIHIEDLASAHVEALNYLQRGGSSDVFNVGCGRAHSVLDVINSMKRVSRVDFAVKTTGRRPGDSSVLVADNSKIKRLLNWQPKFDDLDLICKTAFEWEMKLQERTREESRGLHSK